MTVRIEVRILRTPFGLTNAELATRHYGGGDTWSVLRARHLREHLDTIAYNLDSLSGELLGVDTSFRETTTPDYDGRLAEWWSAVKFDRR